MTAKRNRSKLGCLRLALALAIATIFSLLFAQIILDFLLVPYSESIGAEATLQTLKPTEGLETYFKVALLSGAIIAMPVILIQFWLFISPGTTDKERRYSSRDCRERAAPSASAPASHGRYFSHILQAESNHTDQQKQDREAHQGGPVET